MQEGTRRHPLRLVATVLALYCVGCVVAGVMLAELTLRPHKLPLDDAAAHRARFQQQFHTAAQDVAITAADGAILKAWFINPTEPNGRSVIILHGLGANRIGSTGYAETFLREGYAVLLPDSREHGESGGELATYGILEKYDVNLWVQWMRQRVPGCTFLLGESMGAAVGLQATTVSPGLCAVAVESPYATFREISYERLGRGTKLGTLFWSTLGRPVIGIAIDYTKLRYGIYLPDADPKAAVEQSSTPALLIADAEDRNIPVHHAEELEAACASHCTLWIVPGADHGGASTVAHLEFEQRVVNWFDSHDSH